MLIQIPTRSITHELASGEDVTRIVTTESPVPAAPGPSVVSCYVMQVGDNCSGSKATFGLCV